MTIEYRRSPPLTNEILEELLQAAWDERAPQDHVRVLSRSLAWFGAYNTGRLVGYANLAWDGWAHAFLLDPTVRPEFRDKGIGSRLVQEALAAARKHPTVEWVHVDSSPELMSKFYSPAGFQESSAGIISVQGGAT